jgi:hypothetical protein
MTTDESMQAQSTRIRQVNAETVNDRAKLIMHRLIARQMKCDPKLIELAKAVIIQAKLDGRAYDHLSEWTALLEMEPATLRRLLIARTENMTRLRLSSPFPVVVELQDTEFRRRIWKKAKAGLVPDHAR